MANDDNTDKLGQWRLESAGLHMRADDTDAGKLGRLADILRWLMLAKELPRVEAVEMLCSTLEAAPAATELFRAYAGRRAELLKGDAALFGFHTPETWAAERARNKREADLCRPIPMVSNEWAARDFLEETRTTRNTNYFPQQVTQPSYETPGVSAAVRYIREHWPTPPRRRMDGTSTPDVLDYAAGGAFGLSVRERDAHALWGWGVEQADATVEAAELTTYADLVRHRRANPLADWDVPANQRALLRAEVDRAESAGESRPRTRIGGELGVSKTRIGQVLSSSPGMRATARAKRASNVKPLDVHRKAS